MSTKLLRTIGILEGTSFLLLTGIAMPLKYIFNRPEFVPYIGMTHGVLFITFIIVLLTTCHKKGWSITIFLLGIIAACLPLMPFLFDRKIKKLDTED